MALVLIAKMRSVVVPMNLAIALVLAGAIGGVRAFLLYGSSQRVAVLWVARAFAAVAVFALVAIGVLLVTGG